MKPEGIPKKCDIGKLCFLSQNSFFIKGKNCKKTRILKNIGKKEVRKFAG